MTRSTIPSRAADAAPSGRPVRAFLLALGVVLASGIALAAWSATDGLMPERGAAVPRGPLLDHLVDQAQASPTQRAQAHQIVDAAEAGLRQQRGDERADRARMAQLFSQPTLDAAAFEAVRSRLSQRHDLASRRATQALIDVGLVLNVRQRQTIASQLADGPRPFAVLDHPPAALAVTN